MHPTVIGLFCGLLLGLAWTTGGFGGLVGKLKAAAEEANKADKGDKKSSAPPKQETIATMKDEVSSITSGPISADLFAPPAGYREVKRQMPQSN